MRSGRELFLCQRKPTFMRDAVWCDLQRRITSSSFKRTLSSCKPRSAVCLSFRDEAQSGGSWYGRAKGCNGREACGPRRVKDLLKKLRLKVVNPAWSRTAWRIHCQDNQPSSFYLRVFFSKLSDTPTPQASQPFATFLPSLPPAGLLFATTS